MENPRKRKASPAQLRARAAFAARARAGKFRRRRNPRRQKTVGALKAEQARLVAKLKKTPTTVDASRTIARLGDLNVAIAAAKRRDGAGKRGKNPAQSRPMTGFQVAALRHGKILFLAGIGLSSNRETASLFGSLKAARRVAGQVRNVAGNFGITRVAVVTKHDAPGEIRSFLLGEARGAAGKTR